MCVLDACWRFTWTPAIEFPGNQEQTASLESDSWITASRHEEMPGGVKGMFVHSCSVVKVLLTPILSSWTGSSRHIVPPQWCWYRVPCNVTLAVQFEPVVQVVVLKGLPRPRVSLI